MTPVLLTPDMNLDHAAASLSCTWRPCARGYEVSHTVGRESTVIGYIPAPWQAQRPDNASGPGFKTFHRSPVLAILALLTTFYTPDTKAPTTELVPCAKPAKPASPITVHVRTVRALPRPEKPTKAISASSGS